jgi:SAM-dependent methyltransferase
VDPVAIADALKRGDAVEDEDFDAMYPPAMRGAAAVYWTPVPVAARAAALLATEPGTRILDVGSGVGKFCLVGAAVTDASFVGVEQRLHLVEIARDAALRLRVSRARFVHGSLDDVDPSEFGAFYFFNPFEENTWDAEDQLDQTVALSRERFALDVERAERLLAAARVGARVATYHGFGGAMPPGYLHAHRERHPRSYLDIWVKAAAGLTK